MLTIPNAVSAGNISSIDLTTASKYLSISDSVSTNLNLSGSFTLESWVKFENLSNTNQWGDQTLFGKFDGAHGEAAYWFFWREYNHSLSLFLSDDGFGGTGTEVGVNWIPVVDVWYHIAVSWDENTKEVKFYVNGIQIGSTKILDQNGIHASTEPFVIGMYDNNPTTYESFLDGKLDEIRLWDYVRSQAEINANYQIEINTNEDGLVSYWKFNGNFEDEVGGLVLNNPSNVLFSSDVPFGGEFDNDYPLYTQIESPYPSIEETSDWSDDIYADGVERWCGNTIGGCGCVISSLVMAGRNVGIENDILGNDVNPKNLNEYLQSVSGYTNYGGVRWLAASAYLGELNGSGKITSRFASEPKQPSLPELTMSFIDNALLEGNNAVLAYKNGHFVWLPEKTSDSYVVQDPWWYETETADDVDDNETYVRDYDNTFTDARVLQIYDVPVEFSGTDIEAHLTSKTAELLFTNSLGDKVGYEEGGVLIDLDRATYGNTELVSLSGVPAGAETGKHLLVYEAGEEFTLEVVGTGVGEFTLEFFTIDEYGYVTTFEFRGLTFPGVVTTFTFNLATGEVEEQPITLEQFLSIMYSVLTDMTPQQIAFFERWAEKMFAAMEEKTVSQAVQTINTFGKLLLAKKIDDPIMSSVLGKLITEVSG